jgi:hypothetical protein
MERLILRFRVAAEWWHLYYNRGEPGRLVCISHYWAMEKMALASAFMPSTCFLTPAGRFVPTALVEAIRRSASSRHGVRRLRMP